MDTIKIGDIIRLKKTRILLTVVPESDYDPFTNNGKVNILEAQSYFRMGDAVLLGNDQW
ncbi:hypothetical protein NDS46_30605 (plasmid) [Paenibacillus thiaminolyticus]|uniref:hypothetical protein n=1 Tax=Paenibacillus thiaminolyticus TaxID=49283 RepID=UPI00232FEA8B|nr:hypothetical protein [Paenibacillus thiaminolyticus]WCF11701.1 hypothetical protein NDS46_30605 [Paenibacillus thiaminolyticus]